MENNFIQLFKKYIFSELQYYCEYSKVDKYGNIEAYLNLDDEKVINVLAPEMNSQDDKINYIKKSLKDNYQSMEKIGITFNSEDFYYKKSIFFNFSIEIESVIHNLIEDKSIDQKELNSFLLFLLLKTSKDVKILQNRLNNI